LRGGRYARGDCRRRRDRRVDRLFPRVARHRTTADGAIERLHAMCRELSPVLAGAPVLRQQACFRPIVRDGLPLIGRVRGVEGAYIATGHSVWGILNAPATGEAMAELIADGEARSVDLAPFNPARLRPLDPGQLRRVL
jgi:glycine/D-amino acid oxidase-like deaminating enzyme